MKLKQFSLLALFIAANIYADIVETNRIRDIEKYLSSGTLVIFDIDNTLIEPNLPLQQGSSQWFDASINYYQEKGYSYKEALNIVLPIWFFLQDIVPMRLVESEVIQLIDYLKKQSISFIALTTRSSKLRDTTKKQLLSVGIDLSTSLTDKDLSLVNTPVAYFSDGIAFCGTNDKGRVIGELIAILDLCPQRVIFVDDKRSCLESVARAMEPKSGIEFIGLRYGYLDWKVFNFIANNWQDSSFCEDIISDNPLQKYFQTRFNNNVYCF